jgi:hypothetical protein
MLVTSLPISTVQAGMVSTDRLIEPAAPSDSAASPAADRERIEALLAKDEVRAQLVKLGIDPAEAAARIGALTPAELRQIAGQLDQLPAGAGGIETALIIMSVFLFLIILDAFGVVNVFNFVCGGLNDPCPGQVAAYPAYPPPPVAGPPSPPGRYFSEQAYPPPPPPGSGRYYEELTPRSRVFR